MEREIMSLTGRRLELFNEIQEFDAHILVVSEDSGKVYPPVFEISGRISDKKVDSKAFGELCKLKVFKELDDLKNKKRYVLNLKDPTLIDEKLLKVTPYKKEDFSEKQLDVLKTIYDFSDDNIYEHKFIAFLDGLSYRFLIKEKSTLLFVPVSVFKRLVASSAIKLKETQKANTYEVRLPYKTLAMFD